VNDRMSDAHSKRPGARGMHSPRKWRRRVPAHHDLHVLEWHSTALRVPAVFSLTGMARCGVVRIIHTHKHMPSARRGIGGEVNPKIALKLSRPKSVGTVLLHPAA